MCKWSIWGKLQNSDKWNQRTKEMRDSPRFWKGSFNIVKMSVLPTWFIDSMQLNKNPNKLFCGCWQTDSQYYLERQKT